MKTEAHRRTSVRANREDGDVTKARIIEMAGRLFAERGYGDATSKEICEQANVSITSVNYHFGSRDGLYMAVLREMHDFFSCPEQLAEMEKSSRPPHEKLTLIMQRMVAMMFDNDRWQIRLWAREMLSPSVVGIQEMRERGHTGIGVLLKVIGEITGLAPETPDLKACFVNVMSPFIFLLLKDKNTHSPHREIFDLSPPEVLARLQKFIFAGLDAFVEKPADGK